MAIRWNLIFNPILIALVSLIILAQVSNAQDPRSTSNRRIAHRTLFHPSTFSQNSRRYRPYGRTTIPTLSPHYLTRYNLTTTPSPELRGDQMPHMDDFDDEEDYGEMPPIIYHLQDNYRHPLQYTRSTRIPLYHVNHIKRVRPHPCEHSSCYPATGNLLIGRENRLYASSTCGVKKPERFCIVSHLEEKKCFLCDTRKETEHDPLKNHRVGQIIYKNQPGTLEHSWWQSENGVEKVSLQLDLEAEFHFTHLILIFATFRPAAMLVERSYDFGRTWHVYRYFAYNCAESFPGVPTISRNITDVICDSRYSSVEPSKNGEVIFRVLPPNMNIANPYADHVQNVLKMTNLRINFTKLHSLGDTLLDDRDEIQEKYYYGITNMIVRGSCSCYGHASRCLPLDGVENRYDMVHGKCECTHNTKGLNCEQCEDFYNDLPWNPALGKQTNACKRCNCNDHASKCHFDQQVYENSGRVSGGVCDGCEHNTQGQHCEQCLPFFYRDPLEDIRSPYVCKPCNCDERGSLNDGICDSVEDLENGIVAGACHCKPNVKGRQCDHCKEGYWNFTAENPEGCQECTCNILGTINNSGCNVYTGECTCKRYVTGRDCNQCTPETYGLSSSEDGCTPCDCDVGGSLDNDCDVITGQCKCRPHMTGRNCSTPKQHYFIPTLHTVVEAEDQFTICTNEQYPGHNCSIVVGDRSYDRVTEWTGPGYIRVNEGSELTFTVDDVPKTSQYDVVIRYVPQQKGGWEDVLVTIIRPDIYDPSSSDPCRNKNPDEETEVPTSLSEYDRSSVVLYDVCLEKDKKYKFVITFRSQRRPESNPSAQILIDSIALIPRIEVTTLFSQRPETERIIDEIKRYNCNATYYEVNYDKKVDRHCQSLIHNVEVIINNGATECNCNPTGSVSKKCSEHGGECTCKPNIVGRQCDRCAPSTYGFSPEGCKPCDCNSIGSKTAECDLVTGQCDCHPNTYGRECNQCQPGYWNFPNCEPCQCNGHSGTCDSKTGECLSCQDYTTGYNCDRCIDGYYGDPYLGSDIGCRPCRCPDTIASGHSYASSCALVPSTQDVICHCEPGFAGARCDMCADNYYGNPDKPGGICKECDCNGNVDYNRLGNCDARTGKCLQCLFNTGGDSCEYCKDGYYGDATRQDCRRCDCNVLGTNATIQHCDRFTGQCPCLKNVEGKSCDQCAANHWKIASGEGCEPCACDPIGSMEDQCNEYTGQCECKQGFGGRQCNECETNFWGDPNEKCSPCDCDVYGSATSQCDRTTGQCVCHQGIGGYKCNQCARGYIGDAPHCRPCGECFDNWDLILMKLRAQTDVVLDEAKQIKTLGATGAYTKEFESMALKIQQVQELLENTTIDDQTIAEIQHEISVVMLHLNDSRGGLEGVEDDIKKISYAIGLSSAELDRMQTKSEEIKSFAHELKENATKLQEANVEGALNLTRDALHRVNLLEDTNRDIRELNNKAEKHCKRIEQLINRNSVDYDTFNRNNDELITQYQAELEGLSEKIPDLNEKMCDKRGDPCDSVCGGAGCNHCGGISCEKGALTKAEQAYKFAKDTEKIVKLKEEAADDLIRSISQAKSSAVDGYRKANNAFKATEGYYNETEKLISEARDLITTLTDLIDNNTASPDEIKHLADQTINQELTLDPDEIKYLAKKIDETVAHLENVDSIIAATRNDMERVEELKADAEFTKKRAEAALKRAEEVVKDLNDAEEAQTKARVAIKQANEDIDLAKIDLEQIDNETGDAQTRASSTDDQVQKLNERLQNLVKNSLKNDLDAKDIKSRADNVKDLAGNAHELVTQLKNEYLSANASLTERARKSEGARERAQLLLSRASKITVDTANKLKELQSMNDLYKTNEKELNDLEGTLNRLNVDVAYHLNTITERASYYRQCTS